MNPSAQVLFICTGNYYRSRFAEALFNYYADLAALPWHAISRGFTPHLIPGDLAPQVEEALWMRGISPNYVSEDKQALRHEDLKESDRVIALQEDEHRLLMRLHFPAWVDEIEYWSTSGTARAGMFATLPVIEAQVQDLVAELARELVPR
jgi:protein-tyrosine phosphatase